MNIRVEVPATRTIGVEVFPLTRNILVEVRTAAESGGGVSTFVELADSTTAALPTLNSPLAGALATKAPLASPTFTGNVSGITAAMVGLGNVSNTSDANKPVSTAQQDALDHIAESVSKLAAGIHVTGATGALAGINGIYYGMGNHTSNPDLFPNESPITRPYFTRDSSGATFPNDAGGVDGNGYILFYWQLNDNWFFVHNGMALAYASNLDAGQDPMQIAAWKDNETGNDSGIILTRFYPQASFANLAGSPDDNPSLVQNALLKSGNLSGLYNPSTARTNLGIGTSNNVHFLGILSTPISGSSGSFTTLAASGVMNIPIGASPAAPSLKFGSSQDGFSATAGQTIITSCNGSSVFSAGIVGIRVITGGSIGWASNPGNSTPDTALTRVSAGVVGGPSISLSGTLSASGLATLSGGVSTTTLTASGLASMGQVAVSSATFPPFSANRTTPNNSGTISAAALDATSSTTVIDTFGPQFLFRISGTGTGGFQNIGSFGCGRAGNNTSGAIYLSPAVSGVLTERLSAHQTGVSVTGTLTVTGAIESTTAAAGLILKSPNGTRYRVTVSDVGMLTTALA